MNESIISIADALKIFSIKDAKGMYQPFDISYRTFNETTKKGGKLKQEQGVKYLPSAKYSTVEAVKQSEKMAKPPNHFKNRTRNIELANGDIKTIRIDFIISINNQKVIY